MRRVDGIPITIDALASISAHLPALLKLIGESVNVEHIQKKNKKKQSILLGTARIIYRILEASPVNKCRISFWAYPLNYCGPRH